MKRSQNFTSLMILLLAASAFGVLAEAAEPGCTADAARIVYPLPQKACLGGEATLPTEISVSISSKSVGQIEDEYLSDLLKSNGIKRIDGASAGAGTIILEDGGPKHKNFFRQEGYTLSIGGKPLTIRIAARGSAGLYYGLVTLRQLIRKTDAGPVIYTGDIEDFPRFIFRGVLEGGYSVWGHEERLSVIKTMGALKMNSFMYAPKEGELFRRRWRVLYNERQLDEFRQYLDACNKQHIEFSYALSPALSMEYSDPAEFDKLVAKFRQIQNLGVRRFAIFFDDVLPMLSTPSDKRHYSHIAEAEVDVTNKLLKALRERDKKAQLAFVPNQYWGWTQTRYFKILRQQLDPDIEIGWTGKEIVSETIPSEDAQSFIEVVGRKPAIGDNWSPFGPVTGRAPDLFNYSNSYLNNPYNYADPGRAQRSRFVDATVADYGWNPEAYEPQRSFKMAINVLSGDSKYGDILTFAMKLSGEMRYSGVKEIVCANRLSEILEKLTGADSGSEAATLETLGNTLSSYLADLNGMMAGPMEDDMKNEIKPNTDKASEKISSALAEVKAFGAGGDKQALIQKIKGILGLKS